MQHEFNICGLIEVAGAHPCRLQSAASRPLVFGNLLQQAAAGGKQFEEKCTQRPDQGHNRAAEEPEEHYLTEFLTKRAAEQSQRRQACADPCERGQDDSRL